MQTGPQGLELPRNDWDGDGEITFNDLLLLLSLWSQEFVVPPPENWPVERWWKDNLHLLPMDSDHPLRLEANQRWQSGLDQLQDLIDAGVYNPDYVYYYDYNGDGVLTQEDHTLMTEIWQSGIWPLWAYEWSNQFAPPDLEVPDLPKPRLPKRILPRRGKSSPFRSTRKGR